MRCGLSVVVLLGGCNVVFGVAGPADVGARVCARGGMFPASTLVDTPGSYNVEAVRFDRKKTRAYFALFPDGATKDETDIYTADYLPETDAFSGISRMGGVSSIGDYDSYPSPSPDGQHLLMGTHRFAGVKLVVASAEGGSFDTPTFRTLDLVPGATDANEPYVLGDNTTLLFGSTNAGGGWDLYRASGAPPRYGGDGNAVPIDGANLDSSNEFAPVETDDELEIFFASNRERPGEPNLALDIFTASRADPGAPFGTPMKVATLSPGYTNFPLWISADACELYFIDKTMTGDQAALRVARR